MSKLFAIFSLILFDYIHGKYDFAKISKAIYRLEIILLDSKQLCVERLSMVWWIHFFELSIVHNYFDNPNKTTFKSVAKFVDTFKTILFV